MASSLVQARLINGPFGDPGMLVDFQFGRRALLFDLGDLADLSPREILRVTDIFVSHTHMDHFAGFDRLLRLLLHRPEPLRMVGPAGFADRVENKLAAYTWNLLGEHSPDFVIHAVEFEGGRVAAAATFRARRGFRREDHAPPDLPGGVVLRDDEFSVHATVLDHGMPSLAFAFQETVRVNVWKERLGRLGLPVGPWLNEAKRLVRTGAADGHPVIVPGRAPIPLGLLKEQAFRIGPGQRIVYVTDVAFTEANVGRIVELARDADHLFIEATFLGEDEAVARERMHLTAAQAGMIARLAGAAKVTPFHFSPRYLDREDELRAELQATLEEPSSA